MKSYRLDVRPQIGAESPVKVKFDVKLKSVNSLVSFFVFQKALKVERESAYRTLFNKQRPIEFFYNYYNKATFEAEFSGKFIEKVVTVNFIQKSLTSTLYKSR